MKSIGSKFVLKSLATLSLVMLGSAVFAASTWSVDLCSTSSSTSVTQSLRSAGEGCRQGTDVGENSVHAYAYAVNNPGTNTSSTATFSTATLAQWGSDFGLGVTYGTETSGSPEHTMDNNYRTELIAFRFDSAVTLGQVNFGYTYNDADFSLFAWSGLVAPSATASDKIVGQTVGGLASSWTLVGNYAVAAGSTNNANVSTNVNNANVSSTWWIVSAYNTGYGGALDGTAQNSTTPLNSLDYVKVMSLVSKAPGTPGTPVPEPGSIALLGLGLVGIVVARRRKQAPL